MGMASCGVEAAEGSPVPIDYVADESANRRAQEAFRAVFGRVNEAPVVREGRDHVFRPVTVIVLNEGLIALVSAGTLLRAGHAEAGLNAIHYLQRSGGRFKIVGQWFGVGAEGSSGNPGSRWGVSRAMGTWPVLYTEGGGTWQGCHSSWAALTELRPSGPVDLVLFYVSYSDLGTASRNSGREIQGEIESVGRETSFTVRYGGTARFRETYVRNGDSYRLAGRRESRMPTC